MSVLSVAFSGFSLGLSLIFAIGSQNAFVLRQGLRGEHVFLTCITCAVSDAFLITVGISSLAAISATIPELEPFLRYGGAGFLALYGARSALSAIRGGAVLSPDEGKTAGIVGTLVVVLSLTFLNPHVYLDTVLLVGSVASRHEGAEYIFGMGAVVASFVFFFSLGYGARLLRPIFANPASWRVLDGVIAVVMWAIAFALVS
ncbi:Arginine exporter protein ArgO [Pseudovibrio sp. Ad46]|uniref:LysE/ArgO family amino acid transporter n=1 Tax=unclassified Pseudovibrio TaxID=2627060 RepID=UPI0007AEDC19|nr:MULTISPECIES: LysE/ArgO family amino acid transporter [unclassified Pseudovibrio]KZK77687.1 Arginine exporter protein ArgO [Pseudovibrio sp. Ad46]KZK93558.1 Arginine exporter protein ArgO [Pseudovibrio sp. Ad5]